MRITIDLLLNYQIKLSMSQCRSRVIGVTEFVALGGQGTVGLNNDTLDHGLCKGFVDLNFTYFWEGTSLRYSE